MVALQPENTIVFAPTDLPYVVVAVKPFDETLYDNPLDTTSTAHHVRGFTFVGALNTTWNLLPQLGASTQAAINPLIPLQPSAAAIQDAYLHGSVVPTNTVFTAVGWYTFDGTYPTLNSQVVLQANPIAFGFHFATSYSLALFEASRAATGENSPLASAVSFADPAGPIFATLSGSSSQVLGTAGTFTDASNWALASLAPITGATSADVPSVVTSYYDSACLTSYIQGQLCSESTGTADGTPGCSSPTIPTGVIYPTPITDPGWTTFITPFGLEPIDFGSVITTTVPVTGTRAPITMNAAANMRSRRSLPPV
ncbi:MAG: hypothetical protein ACHREM_08155 [Polyangiales bacterium]